jgi:hypothetical protein
MDQAADGRKLSRIQWGFNDGRPEARDHREFNNQWIPFHDRLGGKASVHDQLGGKASVHDRLGGRVNEESNNRLE